MIDVSKYSVTVPDDERVIGHYGDNLMKKVEFRLFWQPIGQFQYILYIKFSDGSVNTVPLERMENNSGMLIWNVRAEQIYKSGTACIQLKAMSESSEEIWHSQKAFVEFISSLEEDGNAGSYSPSLLTTLDEKVREIYIYVEKLFSDYGAVSEDQLRSILEEYVKQSNFTELLSDYVTKDYLANELSSYMTETKIRFLITKTLEEVLIPLEQRLDDVLVSGSDGGEEI